MDEAAQWTGRRPSSSFAETCLGASFARVSDNWNTRDDASTRAGPGWLTLMRCSARDTAGTESARRGLIDGEHWVAGKHTIPRPARFVERKRRRRRGVHFQGGADWCRKQYSAAMLGCWLAMLGVGEVMLQEHAVNVSRGNYLSHAGFEAMAHVLPGARQTRGRSISMWQTHFTPSLITITLIALNRTMHFHLMPKEMLQSD